MSVVGCLTRTALLTLLHSSVSVAGGLDLIIALLFALFQEVETVAEAAANIKNVEALEVALAASQILALGRVSSSLMLAFESCQLCFS